MYTQTNVYIIDFELKRRSVRAPKMEAIWLDETKDTPMNIVVKMKKIAIAYRVKEKTHNIAKIMEKYM